MKFISKNSNLRIVLSPGIPANQMSGIAGKPGVYVKFQDGIVDVKDEEMINQMRRHPAFNQDFIVVDDNGKDPYADIRQEIEPVHIIQEMKYGQVEAVKVSPHAEGKIDPKIKKLVDELAMKKVKELLPAMVEEAVKQMKAIGEASKGDTSTMPEVVTETSVKEELAEIVSAEDPSTDEDSAYENSEKIDTGESETEKVDTEDKE